MRSVLGALPPYPTDLSHYGQRRVACAGAETLGLHAPCNFRRHRRVALVASQHCPSLPNSALDCLNQDLYGFSNSTIAKADF